jgi:hypothetical protein
MPVSEIPTDEALVHMKRPDGSRFLLRVPGEHLQRVMDLANGEFGDPSVDLGGPELVKETPSRP